MVFLGAICGFSRPRTVTTPEGAESPLPTHAMISPEIFLLASRRPRPPAAEAARQTARLPLTMHLAQRLAATLPNASPAELYALGLLQGAFRLLLERYRGQHPRTCGRLEEALRRGADAAAVEAVRRGFAADFGAAAGATLWEDILLLAAAQANPATRPLRGLFAPPGWQADLERVWQAAQDYFAAQPPLPPENLPVPAALLAPARRAPHSLTAQLAYVLDAWGEALGEARADLLRGLDFAREAERRAAAAPPPPSEHDFTALPPDADAPEAYSPDQAWMPHLVLVAKHVYVWLAQLSRRFGRDIHRLDQIPDEALAELAEWGLNGLWLIGVWERSPASQKIKRLMGNPDALASAYSVYDYRVAADLGGEDALQALKAQAARFGIRLGADMVPNHMGLDSRWVVEHPDWFIQTDAPPFPNYRYTGPDLSSHPAVEIRIEDGYYDHSDAAVVFQMRDHRDGRTRYIYHGNDGTAIPWNDTAQLNHLLPEVREALISTILEVARRFPVIRFDAAMTLTQKHYQRLWFPAAGEGGAIPSRAAHGMTRAEFLRHMPREFWREVVERVAAEAPDTLLLAEAFWLLEGYFVRTLGMHRVYNSAFMHMLRDERNAAYHKLVQETLTFDPRILQRYVNFMTTPDEKPAVEQFGKGDKYFGVATLMATLPGLPMFGHGQIEGLKEQYGHEFRAPRTDESRDEGFIAEHRRRIAPLLRQRALFAGVEAFRWFPLETPTGEENPHVFGYTNRRGGERALVLYHNRYAETEGRLYRSAPFVPPEAPDNPPRSETLAQALGLPDDGSVFVRFRDLVSGLWYLRNAAALHREGLRVHLRAYQTEAFMDWEILPDPDGRWARLAEALGDAGAPDLEAAYREHFPPLREAAARLAETWQQRLPLCQPLGPQPTAEDAAAAIAAYRALLEAAGLKGEAAADALADFSKAVQALPALLAWAWQPVSRRRAGQRKHWRGLLCPQPAAQGSRAEASAALSLGEWLLAALALPPLPLNLRQAVAEAWGIPPEALLWLSLLPLQAMLLPKTPKARQRALAQAVSAAPLPPETAQALLETWARLHAAGE